MMFDLVISFCLNKIFIIIIGWCPPENDNTVPMLIQEVLNFTIFVKNFIEFPIFNVKHKNMVDNLKPCVFNEKTDKDCPIYSIGYILHAAEKNASELELMLKFGGVIRMKIEWDCDLDRHIRGCRPDYSFARLDVPFRDRPFSKGFNFRFASHWKHQEKNFRTLTKAYGLRLIVTVSGKAGKFDFITLTLNIGSVVGIFGLATFLCDIILFHLSKKARVYRNYVFETVHLRTRTESMNNDPRASLANHDDKDANSKTNIKSTLLNGSIENTTKTPPNTVVMRPLTFGIPNPLIESKLR
jgi:P2X purinoceptor 1